MERETCLSASIGLGTQEGTCPGHLGCQEPEIRVYRSCIPADSSSIHSMWTYFLQYFPGGSVVKHLSANARDMGSVLESGRSPGEGNSNPLQYSCLENSMDRGALWATVYGVTKSQTRLSMNKCTRTVYY